jgi:hypothetical protein
VIARSRVAAAVLAILLVTVAAIAYRSSDPDTAYELIRAPLDQVTAYESGQLRVTDVRVGSEIAEGDDHYRTQGLFVVVDVAVQAVGRDAVVVADSRLRAQAGATYLPAFDPIVRAEPGFETSRAFVYEVDPARLDDLTLELWDEDFVYRYYQRTQTPLGITSANAGQWAQAGRGRTVAVASAPVTKALL